MSWPTDADDPASQLRDVDFEVLFDHAPSGYLVTTDAGVIIRANATFLSWTGYEADDVIGKQLPRLMPVGDRLLYSTHVLPMLQLSGSVAEIAVDIVGPDGVRRSALLSATRRPLSSGAPDRTLVIIFGAHERRRYERELLRARKSVEESTAQARAAQERLQHESVHDALTGLPNRAGVLKRLHDDLNEIDRSQGCLAVFSVDLDQFRTINDSLGAQAGDQLLQETATRLQAELPPTFVVGRLAADEFFAYDQVADTAAAIDVARRILDVLNRPVTLDGLEVVPSASVGIALAGTGDTAGALVRNADIAMHRAKSKGRNDWVLHEESEVNFAQNRLRLLGKLRTGIADGQLRLHYQGRYHLQGADPLHSFEALVRWHHPDRGLLPPYQFIDIAEESGLINELGAWVVDEALAQLMRWQQDRPQARGVGMAVNLSARQLNDPGLVPMIRRALARYDVDPQLLTMEITETALMAEPDEAVIILNTLKELGVKLAADDFGTGYASLTYLKQFPIDELKIDRSFVSGLTLHQDDTAIVASCIQLAHAVGARCVAEGIETELQRTTLIELGCDIGQGFLLARPEPADRVAWPKPRLMPPTDARV